MGKKRETEPDVDNEEYGKPFKYDPTFKGPLYKRSCTDIICLLIFVAFIVAWVAVGIVAFSNGNPARLISPIDYEGNHCGVDEAVANKPYLFYFDITKCVKPTSISKPLSCNTPQVCVAKCPDKVFIADLEMDKNHAIAEFADDLICKYSVNKDNLTIAEVKQECAPWYIPSTKVAGHCIPSVIKFNQMDNSSDAYKYLQDISLSVEKLKENSKVIQLLSQAKEVGETIVRDLNSSWPYIVGGLALAMFLSLIYIVLMRWFAGVMIWFSLFGVMGLLAYCVYASYIKYSEMSDEEEAQNYDDSLEGRFKSILALKSTWLVFLIASAIMLVIILIIILFLRKRIRIAVALIGEASRAVGSATSTLAFPLVPWLLQLAVIAWAVSVGLCLLASAKPSFQVTHFNNSECLCNYTVGSSCTPQQFHSQCHYKNLTACEDVYCLKVGRELDTYLDYMHVLNIFGFFWGLFFMSAFGEMVLAGTFATWYWTFKKSDVPFFTLTHSLLRTLRYHLGTLAFGSLILAICRMIRVMLEYVNSKLSKYDNAFVKALMCCLRCFFWCLEKFIRFINRNAYIMCAIHGKNFCRSARDAFNLLMRNIIRVFVLDKVTDFLLFLGKFMITAGMVALSFYFFGDKLQIEEIPEISDAVPDLNYYFVPVIVIGIGTYFIASVFFGVYAMAVDTLFLCFLEDCERNDGSLEKPYFMSKHLMKILGKKNKKFKEH